MCFRLVVLNLAEYGKVGSANISGNVEIKEDICISRQYNNESL